MYYWVVKYVITDGSQEEFVTLAPNWNAAVDNFEKYFQDAEEIIVAGIRANMRDQPCLSAPTKSGPPYNIKQIKRT